MQPERGAAARAANHNLRSENRSSGVVFEDRYILCLITTKWLYLVIDKSETKPYNHYYVLKKDVTTSY